MSKRLSSKEKISRRLGVNMWGRPKSPYNKREYGPGQHGQSRRRKLKDFVLLGHSYGGTVISRMAEEVPISASSFRPSRS